MSETQDCSLVYVPQVPAFAGSMEMARVQRSVIKARHLPEQCRAFEAVMYSLYRVKVCDPKEAEKYL